MTITMIMCPNKEQLTLCLCWEGWQQNIVLKIMFWRSAESYLRRTEERVRVSNEKERNTRSLG